MEHIPDAPKLYINFIDEFLAREGYTYDEEGNEYKDGVFTDFSGKSSQQLVFAMLRMTLHGEPLHNERIKKHLSNLFIQEFVVSLQH